MIEQDSLCYINSASSENSDDRMIIQRPDLVSFSLVPGDVNALDYCEFASMTDSIVS